MVVVVVVVLVIGTLFCSTTASRLNIKEGQVFSACVKLVGEEDKGEEEEEEVEEEVEEEAVSEGVEIIEGVARSKNDSFLRFFRFFSALPCSSG